MATVIISLQQFFKIRASECGYAELLEETLLNWSYGKFGATDWEVMENHIMTQAGKLNMTPEKYIYYLFEAQDVNDFMFRFKE